MNRFILKVNIINNDEFGLEVNFRYWNKSFIFDTDNIEKYPFVHFEDTNGFAMYSHHRGEIVDDTLVIPEYSEMYEESGSCKLPKIYKSFNSDEERKLYTLGLYNMLSAWGLKKFNTREYSLNKIVVKNNIWIF